MGESARRTGQILRLLAVAGMLLLVASAAILALGRRIENPSLHVDKAYHDFGTVTPGEELLTEFELRNIGDRELRIMGLQTSCGCAPAKLGKSTLERGESTTISVSIRVPDIPGAVGQVVTFHTNDPKNKFVRLGFGAKATWLVDTKPRRLYLPVVVAGSERSSEVELFSTDGSPFIVTTAEASVPWVRVNGSLGEPARRHNFSVEVHGAERPGPFTASVRFQTTSSQRPMVAIELTGEIVKEQSVSPSRLLLGTTRSGSNIEARLIVRSTNGLPDVRSVTVAADAWQVLRWTSRRLSDTAALVTAQITTPSSLGYQRSSLILRGQGIEGELEVPLACLVVSSIERDDPSRSGAGSSDSGELP